MGTRPPHLTTAAAHARVAAPAPAHRAGPPGTARASTAARRAALALGATLLAAALPAAASAQVAAPGSSPTAPPPSATAPPAPPVPRPIADLLTCRSACSGLQRASAGSAVRLTGEGLAGTATVTFLGGRGPRDDVTAPATASTDTSVDVAVPAGARSGRVRVTAATGRRSLASRHTVRIGPLRAGAARVEARVDATTVFVDGPEKAAVSFFVGGADAAVPVQVDLVRDGDAAPVASWPVSVAPGTVGNVAWDGVIGGVAAPEGRYTFRVSAGSTAAAQAAQAGPGASASSAFLLVGHAFPVVGPHATGLEPQQRFGAGRAGHQHQGVDVMAACGTPVVVAGAGTVKMNTFQGAAGNYVVIAGEDGFDQVYMHLAAPSALVKGAPVATGQGLGLVGDTGDAVGCHLHFELWTAPGWYTGGAPIDPLPALQAWDGAS